MIEDPEADPEIRTMAEEEAGEIRARLPEAERALALRLLPKDAADERSAMLEIRAGTGRDEAALFAGDLLRMYQRYAETRGWKVEMISASPAELGVGADRSCRPGDVPRQEDGQRPCLHCEPHRELNPKAANARLADRAACRSSCNARICRTANRLHRIDQGLDRS